MADIGANKTGRGQADLGVHIGAIHVNLAAVLVDGAANITNRSFVDAMRGRISNHQGRELGGMFGGFGLEVGDIDVAVGIAGDRYDLIAAHGRAGGISAMRAGGNKADVAVAFAPRGVVRANDEQAGVFTLGPRIGLQ